MIPYVTQYKFEGEDDGLRLELSGDRKKSDECWALRYYSRRWNKVTHKFDFEPFPSSRTEQWIKDHSMTLTQAWKEFELYIETRDEE